MQHPEEGLIHAWLDGALSAGESARIEEHVASCDACASAVAEARGLIAASSRIVRHLDIVPGNVIPAPAPKKRTFWSRSAWPAAIAATLLIGIGLVQGRETPPRTSAVVPQNQSVQTVAPPVGDSASAIAAQRAAPPARRGPATVSEVRPAPVQLPPPNVAVQKAAAAEPQPTSRPLAQSAQRSDAQVAESRALASSDAARNAAPRSSLGSLAAGAAAAPSAPSPALGLSDRLPDSSGFAGCYELSGVAINVTPATPAAGTATGRARVPASAAAPEMLPAERFAFDARFQRFALMDEAALTPGFFAVRQLDAAGRPGRLIPGAGWSVENDRAILKNGDGQTLLTFVRSGSSIRGVTSNGERTARVISCRK